MTPSTSLSSITLSTKAKLRYFALWRKTHWSTWRPSPTLCYIGTRHVINHLPTQILVLLSVGTFLPLAAWMTSSQWEQTASMPQITLRSPVRPFTFWFPCWVCRGVTWCTTVRRKWGWQPAALCLQTASTYRLTEGYVSFCVCFFARKHCQFLSTGVKMCDPPPLLQVHLCFRYHGPRRRCVRETRWGTVSLSQGNIFLFLKQEIKSLTFHI